MTTIDDWVSAARRGLAEITPPVQTAAAVRPSALVVTAADFPFEPHTLCAAPAGTFYTIRLAGGLVPPAAGEAADSGFAATLEYAVRVAEVDHIILISHPECGLLRGLLDADAPQAGLMVEGTFLPRWSRQIAPAIARAAQADISPAEQLRFCAQEVIRVSIENLMTYPWILDAAYSGRIGIHGWYCDRKAGVLASFDPATDRFTED